MSTNYDQRSPEEIENEIETTRSEIDRTLEALEERFSVRARIDNAKQRLRTTARTFPIGSAAAVAGVLALAWTLFRSGRRH